MTLSQSISYRRRGTGRVIPDSDFNSECGIISFAFLTTASSGLLFEHFNYDWSVGLNFVVVEIQTERTKHGLK